jgi:hypothetical protein
MSWLLAITITGISLSFPLSRSFCNAGSIVGPDVLVCSEDVDAKTGDADKEEASRSRPARVAAEIKKIFCLSITIPV